MADQAVGDGVGVLPRDGEKQQVFQHFVRGQAGKAVAPHTLLHAGAVVGVQRLFLFVLRHGGFPPPLRLYVRSFLLYTILNDLQCTGGAGMKKFTAGANEDGVRLSRFVESVTSGLPRSLLYKSFRNKRVKVNGRRAEPDARLAAGDVIELYINDEFFPEKPAPAAKPARRQPPVTVVYEDADIAVLYKPAHLLCHSDRTGDANLIDAFTAQLAAAGQYDPHAEQRFAPALCNRLDRGTEGLVIAAKNYAALRDMNEIIRSDWLKKEYLTITVGAPPAGRHIAWLQHSEKGNKVRIHARESEGYKQIITDVSVLRCQGPYALCRIGLVTGRTHQIRAHLAYLGHPVLGDIKYGNRKMNERSGLKTQALCAQRLTFGRIPEENGLHRLSGRCIKLADPDILRVFERVSGQSSV